MRERITWTAEEAVPARPEILRLQGMPPHTAPPPRIGALLDAALDLYLETAEPRAVTGGISREAFAEVYRGEGRNAAEAPLEHVFPRADRLVLFTATVGRGITQRIRALFAGNELALAAMLDSVASAAADRLAELLELRGLDPVREGGGDGRRVLAYSPGYCGWHVSGQRALFAALEPEEIGVTLNSSCLMEPLKSVSGVLVAGPSEIHRFAPDYPFCADCRGKPCRVRMASLTA
jgi:hypothetical protein